MGHVVLIPWGRLAASLFQPCLPGPHSHPPCPPCPPHPPGFVQERWIQGLLAFHCFLLLVVILFRRLPYVHSAVFFGCSERLALGQHGQCPLQGSLAMNVSGGRPVPLVKSLFFCRVLLGTSHPGIVSVAHHPSPPAPTLPHSCCVPPVVPLVYFAERLNKLAGPHWRSFARQNYFDPQVGAVRAV